MRSAPTTDEELYKYAMQDLEAGLYPEALKGFGELKTRYPYSKLAPLADLRLGDTHFERGKFADAIDAYRQFLRLYPTHAEAPYAMYRIGESYAEQMPEEWFFMPPVAEKDQGNTRLAISAYRDLVARYPDSEWSQKARERVDACRLRLAEHELYVARFYFDREKFAAAAARAEGLVQNYPSLGLDAEAFLLAAEARQRMGDRDLAAAHVKTLEEKYPDTPQAAEAARVVASPGDQPAP